jgi:putative hydrolase of the HAD superfamily
MRRCFTACMAPVECLICGMNRQIRVIGFDADDTLWHNETIFEEVHERYRVLLGRYHDVATVDRTLFATEMRNLELYGYGIKGFMLSAIETAIELTAGKISADEIRQLIGLGHEMLRHPVVLLDGVEETLRALAPNYRMILITKGDLRDQERKVAKSGLAKFFEAIEIVSEKNIDVYEQIFSRREIAAERFLMVGNSAKSDILPVLKLGGAGAYIPYHLTWAGEHVEELPKQNPRFFRIENIRLLPQVLEALKAC